jgi:predicted HicB family RNase H-like nuclease
MMKYKGYLASVVFDDDNELFHGEVLGIRDVVTFQGRSVQELRKAFQESVDDYLDFCRARGESPDKPASGRFVLRVSPQLHRDLCREASRSGQSLNAWITSRLQHEVRSRSSPTLPARKRRSPSKPKVAKTTSR